MDGGNTCRGAAFYMRNESPVTVNNLVVDNNEGSGICVMAGKVNISNSTITNNAGTHSDGGGGIQIRGSEAIAMVDMTITNTVIANNTSTSYGGGISIFDDEAIFSKITIDDQSKIYDNESQVSGDDFAYRRTNDSENLTDNSITLDNISIAGITGVDGWYHDNEDDRYADQGSASGVLSLVIMISSHSNSIISISGVIYSWVVIGMGFSILVKLAFFSTRLTFDGFVFSTFFMPNLLYSFSTSRISYGVV